MAAAACKIIINNGLQALMQGLEKILLDPDIYGSFDLPELDRLELVQRLADCDLAVYTGNASLLPEKGLSGVLADLQAHGLVTDEVWTVFQKP